MRYVTLGKTDLRVSEVGFGGIPIIRVETDTAVDVLRRAYDRGITFYDTANLYHDSEAKMGRAFSGLRDKVVLATKTRRRDAAGAMEELENSLRMLKTDYIDLYQLHMLVHEDDWSSITAPGGAWEAVVRAREQGKIRFVGVTCHRLEIAVRMVKTGLFATVQFPFNFIEEEAKNELHAAARELGVGILAMKPFAGGAIDNAALAFKFLRQYADVIPLAGFDSVDHVDQVVSFYEQANVLTGEDEKMMAAYRAELGRKFCRRCEYCQPCPNGVMITPAMGYRILSNRMSPRVSVPFAQAAMATVAFCLDCRTCIERCPYELPIPEILQENFSLYEQHRAWLATGNPGGEV